MFDHITVETLRKAIAVKEQIEELETELQGILGGQDSAPAPKRKWTRRNGVAVKADKPKRRGMSAAGRKRLAESARLRWKKAKAAGKVTL